MTEGSPKVSIVLPTHNGSKYIQRSVESCLNQTYKNVQLVIVNDGSSDNTSEIIKSFKDERIHFCDLPKNLGIVGALNKGFSLTTGEFLSWTSDDNYYDSRAIEVMVNTLRENQSLDFVYAQYNVVDEDDQFVRMGRVEPPKGLDIDNYVGGCFLFRRKVYESIGDFNPDSFLVEDYEYWLRVREKFRMKKIDECLYTYRMHEGNLTAQYKEDEVQSQVEKVRDQFIRPWKSHFLHGKKYFYQNDLINAKPHLKKAFALNPFYIQTWRLIALMYLNPSTIRQLRKIKGTIKK